jgi:hypothetical protein
MLGLDSMFLLLLLFFPQQRIINNDMIFRIHLEIIRGIFTSAELKCYHKQKSLRRVELHRIITFSPEHTVGELPFGYSYFSRGSASAVSSARSTSGLRDPTSNIEWFAEVELIT